MKRALAIAASDSSAASGVQADLMVFDHCGVQGVCAVTTIAAQDTFTVRKIYKLPASIVGAQIDAAVLDIGADACKVGWYRSAELTTVIAGRIRRRSLQPLVLDPCLWSERGVALTPPGSIKRMVREIFPLAAVLTVTLKELGVLGGIPPDTPEEIAAGMRRLREMGPKCVVVEDAPAPEGTAVLVCDEAGEESVAAGPVMAALAGGGSLFSAALTAALACGAGPRESARFADAFLRAAAGAAETPGKGLPMAVRMPVMSCNAATSE